ncbi:MAG: right-handed parallel beta-helix repeat-containing protein [Bacteroidota bacterium]
MKKTVFFSCFGILWLSILFIAGGCKKDSITSSGHLNFSVDTLIFDTVFTTVGSTTQQFKIYNPDKRTVTIDEIELAGGSSSPFRINVDGVSGISHSNIELEGEDSLFVFVEVTLSVNGQSLPMIVEDSIRFRTNGQDQYINLAVWGQDAYFHYHDTNEGTWANDKPHVIYDFAAVDSAKSLTIPAGTQVHLHKNSILYVYKGSLHVEGAKDNEVVFQGDRLESFYDDVAGQWYGIYFHEAQPSDIDYAIIKNGTSGIHTYSADADNPGYTVEVTNTQILNHASYGVFLYSGSKIKMENTLVAKNGRNAFFVLVGGSFSINHCDLLGYGQSDEQNIAFAVKNYFTQDGTKTVGHIEEGKIYNSVIYGSQEDEFALDTNDLDGAITLNFDFRNCLIRKSAASTHSMFQSITWNTDPAFINIEENDFHFAASSPLNGGASAAFSLPFDLEAHPRSGSNPDIGCYEKN